MRKYIEVIKITLKELTEYRFNLISGIILSILKIVLAFVLWRAVFNEKEIIEGFTFNMMLTYYVLITFFSMLSHSEFMLWQFAEEIKMGKFTKYVVRPINPLGFFTIRSLARTFFTAMLNILALIVWVFAFKSYMVAPSSILDLVWVAVFVVLGLFTMIQTHYMISMFSFKLVEIIGFYYMLKNFIELFTGALIPLVLLPDFLVSIIKYLPYYYVLYYPASIYLGIHDNQMILGLGVVILWNILLTSINYLMYKKLFSCYEGVGA